MNPGNGKTPSGKNAGDKGFSNPRPATPLGARSTTSSAGAPIKRTFRSRAAGRQRLRNLLLIGSGVLVAIIVVAALLFSRSGGSSASALTDPNGLNPLPALLAVGTKAPDFNLATVDGQKVSLSGLSGHPVVLEFFAVWCPHCQAESTVLNQVDQTYTGNGVRTLGVLANPFGKDYETSNGSNRRLADSSDLSWFETTFNVKHPSLIDPSYTVVNEYGASSYPSIYIVDGSGVIRFARAGEVPYQDLANVLNQLH